MDHSENNLNKSNHNHNFHNKLNFNTLNLLRVLIQICSLQEWMDCAINFQLITPHTIRRLSETQVFARKTFRNTGICDDTQFLNAHARCINVSTIMYTRTNKPSNTNLLSYGICNALIQLSCTFAVRDSDLTHIRYKKLKFDFL